MGIYQRVLLQCLLRQPENGMLSGWFSCPTHDRIAVIHFMKKVTLENPHFNAFLNRTLLIKKVLPMYYGRYFIMRVKTDTGAKASIYRRKVVQGNVYLLIILFYMLSPCVLLSIFCFNVKGIGVLTSLPIFIIFPLTYF